MSPRIHLVPKRTIIRSEASIENVLDLSHPVRFWNPVTSEFRDLCVGWLSRTCFGARPEETTIHLRSLG